MPRIFKAVLLSTLSTICLNAHAAKVPLEYSFDIGMSNITKNGESLTGFTSRGRLNYYFTPFAALDLSYTDTLSISDDIYDGSNDTITTMEYKAISTGVKIHQPVSKLINVYAAAGGAYSTVDEKVEDIGANTKTKDSESSIKPYANVGVSMNSPWQKGLQFSLDYTYQPLALDYTANYFSIGAHYSF